jgi:hypothetical protein
MRLGQAFGKVDGHEKGEGDGDGDGVGVGVGTEPEQATKPKRGHDTPSREQADPRLATVPHTPSGSEQGVVCTV